MTNHKISAIQCNRNSINTQATQRKKHVSTKRLNWSYRNKQHKTQKTMCK